MCFNLILQIFVYIWFSHLTLHVSCFEREVYLDLEHPKVTYTNPKYFSYITVKSERLRRGDPLHYVTLLGAFSREGDKKMKCHFYFYELLTNVYKPSFVEFHYNICELFQDDGIIGTVFRNAVLKTDSSSILLKCPIPVGEFKIYNLSVPPLRILQNFPFREARIYLNFTYEHGTDITSVIEGYIDMEVKPYPKKKKQISKN